jgi:hypothetical protein
MLIGISGTPALSGTQTTALSPIPPASSMPKGSMVLLSTSGTDKSDLVQASLFWLALAAGAGFVLGRYTGKRK